VILAGCQTSDGETGAGTPVTTSGTAVSAQEAEAQSRIHALESVRASLLADRAARQAAATKSMTSSKAMPPSKSGGSDSAATPSGVGPSFDQLAEGLPGDVGIAYAPVGEATHVRSLGQLSAARAWSTMKVPVAMAAVKAADGSPTAQTKKLMYAAITRSDNAAADSL
jgi:beta-lactamase class A